MKIKEQDLARIAAKYKHILGLEDWKFTLRIQESPDDEQDSSCSDAQGYTQILDGYSTAHITVNAWRVEDVRDLDRLLAHEVSHCALAQISLLARDACGERLEQTGIAIIEQTVDRVAKALERAAKPTRESAAKPVTRKPKRAK